MTELLIDKELWRRLQQGDSAALKLLFERYYPYLVRSGIIQTGDPDLARDAVHDLFFSLWARKSSLTEPDNIKAYLGISFRNQLLLLIKNDNKRMDRHQEWAYGENLPEYSYEEILINAQQDAELKEKLIRALEQLTPRQKQYIGMKYFEGLSYEQIASNTGQSIKTIYNTVHEGIKTLRSMIRL